MIRIGLGAAMAAAIFAGGAWSGATWSGARAARADLALRAAEDRRVAEIRATEVTRLQEEAVLDLALGKVVRDGQDLDTGRVVFDAGRMRRLFPAAAD